MKKLLAAALVCAGAVIVLNRSRKGAGNRVG